MILVTGATGRVGGEAVRQLATRGQPVRALTRRPAEAGLPPQVEVAEGGAHDARSLVRALDGVDTVFVVLVGDVEAQARNVAAALGETGRPVRVVLLSSSAVLHPVRHRIGDEHRIAEELVRPAAGTWTLLRPGPFHTNALWWARSITERGVARCLVGNQPGAPIDPADIAAVAVAALTGAGHDGAAYELTGPEVLTSREQVAILSRLLGQPIAFEVATKAEAVEAFAAVTGLVAARTNVEALHSPQVPWSRATRTVQEVLGGPPRSFASWAEAHLGRFGTAHSPESQSERRTA